MNKKTICFYTYEFFPFTGGGCGTYIRQMTDKLKSKYNVVILVHNTKEISNQIDLHYSNFSNVFVFNVNDFDIKKKYLSIYMQRSWEFYSALLKIVKTINIDTVEFFEYVGIGYHTLQNRHKLHKDIYLRVRAHGSMKIIDHYEKEYKYDLLRKHMYSMEKYCLINADLRLFPLKAILDDYSKFYNYDFVKVKNKISPLPLDYINKKAIKKHKEAKNFLFFSNLKRIKSPETYVNAAVLFLSKNRKFEGKFIIAGSDTPYNSKISYWQYLQTLIPQQYYKYFDYKGRISHDELNTILKDVKAAVICSKWESFSLVFYELINKNIDTYTSNISAFSNIHSNLVKKFNNAKELSNLLNL